MGDISKHFWRREIACNCGCGFEVMHPNTLEIADWVRDLVGYPIDPSSGCRCPVHNENEGGSEDSKHMLGMAMDLPLRQVDVVWVYEELCKRYAGRYGIILYHRVSKGEFFIHVDCRSLAYRKRNVME